MVLPKHKSAKQKLFWDLDLSDRFNLISIIFTFDD